MMLFRQTLFVFFVVCAALTSGALAQEPSSSHQWTGFYIGAHGGGGEGRLEGATTDLTGGEAGGHIGFNWQCKNVVLGVEADLSWMGYDNNISTTITGFNISAGASQDYMTSLRGRLGFVEGPVMLYGTFGIAYTEVEASFSVTGPGINISDTQTAELSGIIGGMGLEYALGPNFSLRGEALWFEVHPDFDFSRPGYDGNVFRGGLSYHFN